ncbi:hypothetical protein YC2023_101404 [Brassica napus]
MRTHPLVHPLYKLVDMLLLRFRVSIQSQQCSISSLALPPLQERDPTDICSSGKLIVFLAARASRTLNQDAIDGAMVEILADPKEARAARGALEQSLDFFNTRADLWKRDHLAIDKYHVRGLRSLVVAGRTLVNLLLPKRLDLSSVIFFAKTDDCQTDDFTRRYISMFIMSL